MTYSILEIKSKTIFQLDTSKIPNYDSLSKYDKDKIYISLFSEPLNKHQYFNLIISL